MSKKHKQIPLWGKDVRKSPARFTSPITVTPIITNAQLRRLGEHVYRGVSLAGCDNTLFFTEEWLSRHMPDRLARVTALLGWNGGYCDCEVLFNSLYRLLEDEDEDEEEMMSNPSMKMYQLLIREIEEEKSRRN